MRPLTDTCPKPLFTVRDQPLIVYHLKALKKIGIDSVVINLSWLGDQIKQALGDGSRFGLKICYSREIEALETAGGIVHALHRLDDSFIVVNADIFTDYNFEGLLAVSSEAHLVLVPSPEHNSTGDFSIDKGFISNQGDKRYTFSGISCYRKSFFKNCTDGRQALAPLLITGASKHTITGELYQGMWNDVGTVERLEFLRSSKITMCEK